MTLPELLAPIWLLDAWLAGSGLAAEPWQLWGTYAVILAAIIAYALERISLELTSLCVVAALLVMFHFFPLAGPEGESALTTVALLSGFANPSLMAIMGLLVIGQGLLQTAALDGPTRLLSAHASRSPRLVLLFAFLTVMVTSAFLNNTPVVIMFIPVLSALARWIGSSPGKVMMPLSFLCILGGMTTLIGSSTNLLVAGAVQGAGAGSIGFFDFTIPGLVLAGAGALYVTLAAPILLPDRRSGEEETRSGRQYIAQIQLGVDHPLLGAKVVAGVLQPLENITLRMIQRGEHAILPPFDDDVTLVFGDVLILAATRQTLADALKRYASVFSGMLQEHGGEGDGDGNGGGDGDDGGLLLAEAVVAPGSPMIGQSVEQAAFRHRTGCIVFGIQRRSRMIRTQLDAIGLEAGDVLLILGSPLAMHGLRRSRDVLLMEWSTSEVPDTASARRAWIVLAGTVAAAASGFAPIAIAAVTGATAMVLWGVLNMRQAGRAIDRRVYLLVGAALAMALALDHTGGARLLATGVVGLFQDAPPIVTVSAFFLLIACMTNMLSNNATAVLFTPIALNTAAQLGMDPMIFIHAVIFAANCSFATPMAYQTNLLTMTPGHYRFSDYVKMGGPLVLVLWITYTAFAAWYYELA